jgi:hypothetical protein
VPRVKGDKYNRKYCKQLIRGMRREGLSINKVCQLWGICRTTYNEWVEKHPEFAKAHEYGKRDYCIYLEDLAMEVASGQKKGNAGVLIFSLKNAEGLGWTDKVEVNTTSDEPIRQINISILPPTQKQLPRDITIIEHESDE